MIFGTCRVDCRHIYYLQANQRRYVLHYPEALEEIIEYFKLFPGVGKRGAERMALAMLEWDDGQLKNFGNALGSLPDKIGSCPECGAVSPKGSLCSICADCRRDDSQICVVENMSGLFAVEKGNRGHL